MTRTLGKRVARLERWSAPKRCPRILSRYTGPGSERFPQPTEEEIDEGGPVLTIRFVAAKDGRPVDSTESSANDGGLKPSQMTGHGAKFGRKMEAAVAALLTHRNTEEAARAVGVAPKTLLRWQQIPEFQAALRRAQRDLLSQTTARLLQAAPTAASMLMKVMLDGATPASAKIRAAENILNHAQKVIELEDVEARLAELERSADENKPGWRK